MFIQYLQQFKFMVLHGSLAFHVSESTAGSSSVSLTEIAGELGKVTEENRISGSIVHYSCTTETRDNIDKFS
jgi:hypothetical protein